VIDPQARDERLLQLLSKHHSSRKNRIIIFVLYKKEAPRVEALLNRKGWKVSMFGFCSCGGACGGGGE
jgi:ATP-dependent RNA helicase DBP3